MPSRQHQLYGIQLRISITTDPPSKARNIGNPRHARCACEILLFAQPTTQEQLSIWANTFTQDKCHLIYRLGRSGISTASLDVSVLPRPELHTARVPPFISI